MDQPMPSFTFNGMSFLLKLRDLLLPRDAVLREVDIQPGSRVLDYGCGPGGYITGAAELVGESGKVYALGIHPLAIQRVQNIVNKRQLTNVETIRSDCPTGLPDNSVDAVFLYDIFHMLSDPRGIMAELHRVLKEDGKLSFSDHHMDESDIISEITNGQLFKLTNRGKRTYSFAKQ